MKPSLLEIIVCPICHGKLDLTKDQLKLLCRFDRLAFDIEDDIPVLLSDKATQLTAEQLNKLT